MKTINIKSMKRILLILSFCVISSIIFGQKVISSNAKINEVTVYLYGAEIKAESNATLTKGRGTYEIKEISPQVVVNSVQISNKQNVDILSISVIDYYDNAEKKFPEIKRMNDSVKLVNAKINRYRNRTAAYVAELDHLKKNIKIGGDNSGVNIADLKLASTYYRERTLAISEEISKINDFIAKENKVLNGISIRKSSILVKNNMSFKKIVIFRAE